MASLFKPKPKMKSKLKPWLFLCGQKPAGHTG